MDPKEEFRTPFNIPLPVFIYILLPKHWQERVLMTFLIIIFPIMLFIAYAIASGVIGQQIWEDITGNKPTANQILEESHAQAEKDKAVERAEMKRKCREYAKNLENFDVRNCD
jgi:hypothetical protein